MYVFYYAHLQDLLEILCILFKNISTLDVNVMCGMSLNVFIWRRFGIIRFSFPFGFVMMNDEKM